MWMIIVVRRRRKISLKIFGRRRSLLHLIYHYHGSKKEGSKEGTSKETCKESFEEEIVLCVFCFVTKPAYVRVL